jgi:hypothetical protein
MSPHRAMTTGQLISEYHTLIHYNRTGQFSDEIRSVYNELVRRGAVDDYGNPVELLVRNTQSTIHWQREGF